MIESEGYYEQQKFFKEEVKLLEATEFYDCTFKECSFNQSKISNCIFKDCHFINCDLSMAKVQYTRFENISFEKSRLLGIDWSETTHKLKFLIKCDNSDLSYGFFANMKLDGSEFTKCKLHEIVFDACSMKKCLFNGSNLMKTSFIKCNLSESNFSKAEAYAIDLDGNIVKGTIVEIPEAYNLLYQYGLEVIEYTED